MLKRYEDEKKMRVIELEKKAKEKREIEKQKKKPGVGSKPQANDYYQWKKVDYDGKISIDCMKNSTPHSECLSPNFFKTFNLVSLKLFEFIFPFVLNLKLIFFIFIGSVTNK